MDPAIVVDGQTLPSDLRVEIAEVNCGEEQPRRMDNITVEFGINTQGEAPVVCNMTLCGGVPITLAALENRVMVGRRTYRGEMQLWNDKQGWGFIKADADLPLPPHVQARLSRPGQPGSEEELIYVRRADVVPGVRLDKGLLVMFLLYIDDKGVG